MKKTARSWIMGILVCLEIFWFPIQVRAEGEIREPDSLYALSAVLMDGDSGRVLFEKNGEEQRPMASTTKIMTCILVLESGRQEETARTSAYAASMPEVHMGAGEGESYKVRDLLYGLMLESYNDAAVILAEHIGGSTQAFAEMMNEKAREIGCESTWFITPNGLDAQEETQEGVKVHSTTAEDLARILRYCIQDSPAREEFLEITRTPSYTFTDTAGNKTISCTNHNAFLSMMEGALTGKTGFTAAAGYCYVGALQRDGKTLIVALLGCGWPNNKNYKWSDTRKLMEYGLENYTWKSFAQAEIPEIPQSLPVENGQTQMLGVTARAALSLEDISQEEGMLLRSDEKLEVVPRIKEKLEAPVQEGEKAGEILYQVHGETWKTRAVYFAETVEKIDFPWCLEETLKRLAFAPQP